MKVGKMMCARAQRCKVAEGGEEPSEQRNVPDYDEPRSAISPGWRRRNTVFELDSGRRGEDLAERRRNLKLFDARGAGRLEISRPPSFQHALTTPPTRFVQPGPFSTRTRRP